MSHMRWTTIWTFHLKCHKVCLSVILLYYSSTCLWLCNRRFCNKKWALFVLDPVLRGDGVWETWSVISLNRVPSFIASPVQHFLVSLDSFKNPYVFLRVLKNWVQRNIDRTWNWKGKKWDESNKNSEKFSALSYGVCKWSGDFGQFLPQKKSKKTGKNVKNKYLKALEID